jgi:hypothetical protein
MRSDNTRSRRSLFPLALLLIMVAVTISDGQGWVVARVSFYIGEVAVKKAGNEEWGGCTLKQPLYTGDAIRTGTESRLEVKMDEEDVIRIDENSELEVSKTTLAQLGGSASRANLKRGRIWTNVRKVVADRENLTVETPTVVAAIRGTIFRMDVPTGLSTIMRVYEGTVEAAENPPQPQQPQVVGPPQQVPPPAQVTVQEWLQLVAANQQLSFTRGGQPQVTTFDAAADSLLDWVQWNRTRDTTLVPPEALRRQRRNDR